MRAKLRPRKSNVLLGITGSVAATKTVDLIRRLKEYGASVTPVMTDASLRFITRLSVETAAGARAHAGLFDDPLAHIEIARDADLLLVAPATANTIGKFATGRADDLLSACYLAFRGPVLIAPAMNTRMYEHPAVRENLDRLKSRGVEEIPPEEGTLACGEEGKGRMASVQHIVEAALGALSDKDLAGQKVIVTAGPTREPLDPVRFISNRSSGKMGYALAKAARMRGAEVILVSGPCCLEMPYGVRRVGVQTAREMLDAVMREAGGASAVFMAAAVADFRPSETSPEKRDKSAITEIPLTPNPDILAGLGALEKRPLLVGFAAETGGGIERAKLKLNRKGADLIVHNDVSRPDAGFEVDTNRIAILDRTGRVEELPLMSKDDAAHAILDRASAHLS